MWVMLASVSEPGSSTPRRISRSVSQVSGKKSVLIERAETPPFWNTSLEETE